MSKSKIFLYFCLSFVGGIFISSVVSVSQLIMLGFLIFGVFLISILWNCKKVVIVGFCLLFLAAGIWRHQTAEIQSSNLKIQNDGAAVNLVGVVAAEPKIGEKSAKLTIKTELGKVLITAGQYPEYRYGDKLKILGKLETPSENIDGWNYRDYLKKDGVFAVMNWPEIEMVGSGYGNAVKENLLSFKNKFKVAIRQFISPPESGFLEALVFGDESGIAQAWKEKMNLTGTRHIAAVSGMNITIIASLVLNFLLAFGLWRKQAFCLSVILLVFYILMIGAPASAVRAGLMGGILLGAQYFGRMSSASRAVVFAATLMLLANPLLLRLDVGFQLSFLAVFGMIYFQPNFSKWLRKIPDPRIFPLRATLSATFSAQVFTLPILIYNFGSFPLISPLTNVLIVPFLAPITILIFAFGLASMVFGPLGYVLSWPVWLSLSYLAGVIDLFSKLPKIW